MVNPPRQWRVAEFSFEVRDEKAYPPTAVEMTVTFRGPTGDEFAVPAFWDGGRSWKVRFMPDRAGDWTYTTVAVEGDSVVLDSLFNSPIMHGGEAARRVDLDIRGYPELRLYVDDAADGTAYDHADWADAELVRADGSIIRLDTLDPIHARQGYKKLGRGTNVEGRPLGIGGRVFSHGLGTHARSEIIYRLPPDIVRFRAWVGVDDVIGKHGSVRFHVACKRPRPEQAVRRRIPGLDGQQGTFSVAPPEGDNPLYRHGGILKVASNHRYLTYTDGTPFYWLGDTWWFCPSDLMPIDGSSNPAIPSAYKHCIAKRRGQGFTIVQMDFLGRIDGKSAFEDFSQTHTVDVSFWQKVDRYMAVANAAGIIPVVGLGWVGRPLFLDEWKILWRYMVARYGACGVTWLICGEYNVQHTSDKKIAETMKLGAFIKRIDPWKRAMTVHPWYFRGDRHQAWREAWYDFIMFQGGHGDAPPLDVYEQAWSSTPMRPVLEGECAYEGIHTFTADDVRNRAWRAFQAGCFGYTYGSQGLWYPAQNKEDTRTKEWGKPTPWWIALERPGADHLGHMRTILESIAWWRLAPLAGAVSTDSALDHGTALDKVIDLTDRFEAAKYEHALWCKLLRHSTVAGDLPEIELHPTNSPNPATLTWRGLVLPAVRAGEKLWLVSALGMDPGVNFDDPKHPCDGVVYKVVVNDKEMLRQHRKAKEWSYVCLDMTEFAGQTITLILATEAGKNSNWDHARFRAPIIVRTSGTDKPALGELYTLPLPMSVLVKADGKDTFVLYFSAGDRQSHSGLRLHGLAPDRKYEAVWHDPRTGASRPAGPIRCGKEDTSAPLPQPPDQRDWVLILRARAT